MDYERPLEHVAILVGPDETISSYDGHDVTFTAWTSRLDNVPDRVLVFVHGARERAWIYGPVADRLAGVFSSTYAMDLRGHALADLSEAQRRGRLEGVRALVEDLAALLTHVRKQHPDATIVLGGQSIGATIALAYVKRANALVGRDARGPVPRIDALLLTSPALQLNLRGSLAALRSSGGLAALLNFGSEFPAGSLEDFTSGSRWYNTFRQTEALSALTWSYVWTLVQLVSFWRLRYPRHVLEPTLIIAGTNDQLIDSAGALRLRAALNHACSPSLVLVEGAYHTVFHDETSSQTDAAISDWVEGIDSVRASQPPTQGDYCVYRSDRWIR
ncbi:MAG: alpha/beta fold hydrolase, partial [Actinomycetota bacterium]|nr:alpha/beta fold hydrolase [Actinomycetota bacterium]